MGSIFVVLLLLAAPFLANGRRMNSNVSMGDLEQRSFLPEVDHFRLWTDNVVPFHMDFLFTDDEKEKIGKAIKHIEQNSCVKFSAISGTPGGNYVLIRRSECAVDTCSAVVGMDLQRGDHRIDVSPSCFQDENVVLHLLLHSLGFDYEHNRPDRDDFVTVTKTGEGYAKRGWSEVGAGALCHDCMLDRELCVKEIYSKYLTYDLRSIMHDRTGPELVAKDGSQSDGVYKKTFGMSEMDKEKLNAFFGCSKAKLRTAADFCEAIEIKTSDGDTPYHTLYNGAGYEYYWDGVYKHDGTYVKGDDDGLLHPVYRHVTDRFNWLARSKEGAKPDQATSESPYNAWVMGWDQEGKPGDSTDRGYVGVTPAAADPSDVKEIKYFDWVKRVWETDDGGALSFKCLTRCDDGWWGKTRCLDGDPKKCLLKCYKIVEGSKTDGGNEAKQNCADNSGRSDAIPAEPKDVEEFLYLSGQLKKKSAPDLWIGITDVGGEDCAVIYKYRGRYLLNDLNCKRTDSGLTKGKKGALCEYTQYKE